MSACTEDAANMAHSAAATFVHKGDLFIADGPCFHGVEIARRVNGNEHPETVYLAGAVVVLDDPSGAACMPGGLWPWGLSAGAPPDPVLIGPVQPCGCSWPFSSGGVFCADGESVCAG